MAKMMLFLLFQSLFAFLFHFLLSFFYHISLFANIILQNSSSIHDILLAAHYLLGATAGRFFMGWGMGLN